MNGSDGRWNCIDDRLPEKNVPVVVFGAKNNYEVARLVEDYDGETVWEISSGTIGVGWYRYWMAIPEPSEAEKKDSDALSRVLSREV